MKLPLSLEELYNMLTTQRPFSSSKEDSMQINQDLAMASQFFLEVSKKRGGLVLQDLTVYRLQNLMKAYRGPQVLNRRFLFNDEAVS